MSVAVHPTPSAVCPAPVVALPYLPAPGQTVPSAQQSSLHTPYTHAHSHNVCIILFDHTVSTCTSHIIHVHVLVFLGCHYAP